MLQFDCAARDLIHGYATPALTALMGAITGLGSLFFIGPAGVVVFALLWKQGRRREAMVLAITILGGALLGRTLKIVFHRPRPAPFFGILPPQSYSFPSGHALDSVCFYVTLALLVCRRAVRIIPKVGIWVAAVLMIAAIGFSRVYLGVHYPSDVLGGYAIGLLWAALVQMAPKTSRTGKT